jgi:hypothetical protein
MRTIHPAIIDQERRRREERDRPPAQVPLYIDVPRQIPPGWEPDPNSPGNYRRIEDECDIDGNRDREGDRGVVIIQM